MVLAFTIPLLVPSITSSVRISRTRNAACWKFASDLFAAWYVVLSGRYPICSTNCAIGLALLRPLADSAAGFPLSLATNLVRT